MWNKLFKKKQSNKSPSNGSSGGASSSGKITKQSRNASTTKCFSFRCGNNSRKSTILSDQYMLSGDPFHFLRESEIYQKPDFHNDNEYPRLYQPEQHQNPQHDENQQINEIFIEIPPPNIRLDLCPVCSRKFAPESLLKHVLICERINTKKRKPFDSMRQRLKGTEFVAVSAPVETRVSPPKTLSRKPSETSLKSQTTPLNEHRNLLDMMSRKSSTISLTSSTTSRPLAKRSVSHQSEKCPHCERVFGYKAYDRHVEWCKEKALIKPNPDCASVSKAKERLKTRINYKAPNLKTKRGQTRDKYSSTSCNGSTHSLGDFDSTHNSMNSSMTSENGTYDPFLSAKKQLEELFSPTTDTLNKQLLQPQTPSTQMINSMIATPTSSKSTKNNNISSNNNNNINSKNDLMTRSLTSQTFSPKTPQPIPKMQSNFRRTSSLRISNRKPKPSIYTPPVKSNIHCGISDEGPISPNFVKAIDYDELPIKSPYSAIKMFEKAASPVRASPSPTLMPSIVNLRDGSALTRKNLKLDIKNPNLPAQQSATDYPLSKTDSLALFLKYENELTEKEMKDKSNHHLINRRANTLNSFKDQKLPDIHSKPSHHFHRMATVDEKLLKHHNNETENESKSHSAPPVKMNSACDSLPLLSSGSDKSRSPSIDRRESPEKLSTPTSPPQPPSRPATLRRKMKYNMDNILFDTDPEVKTSPPSSTDNSNNNSLIRPDSRTSNTESIFEDFDFDQFIASFTDDEKFPIFKDYKMMLNKTNQNTVDDDVNNNNNKLIDGNKDENVKVNSKPIPIQQSPQHHQKQQNEASGMEKLDNLCKMLSGNSDSDESNTDPSEAQTIRSKSSADSAYGSLSRQSQSPLDYRKTQNGHTMKATPPPPPVRQHLELKTTEIVLSPVKPPTFQETIMIPRNGNPSLNLNRSISQDAAESAYSKFCHMCGYKFVVSTAKFCIECGVRRIKV